MFEDLRKVCKVVGAAGGVEGRKRFQKMVHIMKSMGFEFDEKYLWGNYGPYSTNLAQEIALLVENNYLEETQAGVGFKPYSYCLTESGKAFLNKVKETSSELFSCNDELIRISKLLSDSDVNKLELLSTCMFAWEEDEDIESMVSLVNHLKDKFQEGARRYVELTDRLMRTSSLKERVDMLEEMKKELK